MNPSARLERRLLGLLLLLLAGVYVFLILDRRLLRGHDPFVGYLLQYLFLSHASQSYDVLLWMPSSAHGVLSNWHLEVQGSLFQNALLAVGGAPRGTPHLPLYYLGLFMDDLIFLLGLWRLGRRHYTNLYARFFVAAAALGSAHGADHLYWNYRLIFAVPLVLSLIEDFLEDGTRWKLYAALNLLTLTFLGQAFYVPFVTVWVIALYFITGALLLPGRGRSWLRRLAPRPLDLIGVAGSALVAAALLYSVLHGNETLRHYRAGRNADGSVTLDTFLMFPGALNPLRYLDLAFGLTPSKDFSLYAGVGTLAAAVVAIVHRPSKPVLRLTVCLLLTLLLSTGFLSVVAPVAWATFPPLRFYRYLALVAPLVKLFVILLAGHGIQALLSARPSAAAAARTASRLLGWIALGAAGAAVIQALRPDWPYGLSAILNEQIAGLAHRAIGAASGGLLLAGTAAAAAATAALWAIRARRPRAEGVLLALLLAVPAADVFRWKLQLLTEATVSLDDAQAAMQRLEPLPYSPRRSADYANERCRALEAALPTLVSGNELAYDVTDAFLHVDPPRSRYWITQWQTPFDDLHRVRAGQPLGGKYETAPLELQWRAEAPRRAADDPFRKLMGETADKLRVFSRAHVARSDQDLADFLNRPDYRGDTLLLSPRPGLAGDALEPALAAANEELPARVDVRHFDGNRLRVELRLPPGRDRGWLSYADVWHPEWIAEIDGTPVPVERASLAYKAVELRSNVSVVEFRFHSPGRVWSYRLLCFNSLLWIAAVLFALGAELRS